MMAQTVAQIAAAAFTKVNAKITGVVASCTVERFTNGAYDADAGTHTTTTQTQTGRAVLSEAAAVQDVFPEYVAGPADKLFYLEGLTWAPQENDTLTVGGIERHVRAVGDIAGAGSFFAVIAR